MALASVDPGAVAAQAENRNMSTYSNLQAGTLFTPIAVETAGPIGPSGQQLLWDIGRRLKQKSGNPASTFYLLQHISVAVQQGNAISVLGTLKAPDVLLLHD